MPQKIFESVVFFLKLLFHGSKITHTYCRLISSHILFVRLFCISKNSVFAKTTVKWASHYIVFSNSLVLLPRFTQKKVFTGALIATKQNTPTHKTVTLKPFFFLSWKDSNTQSMLIFVLYSEGSQMPCQGIAIQSQQQELFWELKSMHLREFLSALKHLHSSSKLNYLTKFVKLDLTCSLCCSNHRNHFHIL